MLVLYGDSSIGILHIYRVGSVLGEEDAHNLGHSIQLGQNYQQKFLKVSRIDKKAFENTVRTIYFVIMVVFVFIFDVNEKHIYTTHFEIEQILRGTEDKICPILLKI